MCVCVGDGFTMRDSTATPRPGDRPLADGASRDYSRKLDLFNRFAEPELRAAITALEIVPGSRVLDAGCGTGMQSMWLAEAAGSRGMLTAVEISEAHASIARSRLEQVSAQTTVEVGDVARMEIPSRSFDLVWCSNTLNHLADPVETLARWRDALRDGGRVVVGQSAFLQEMVFAWDWRLETEITRACREFYLDKYGLTADDTTNARNIVGFMRRAGFSSVIPRTIVIERTAPLRSVDVDYVTEAIFNGYWRRVRSYLSASDADALARLVDPASPEFALARADFHFLMTFTLVIASG